MVIIVPNAVARFLPTQLSAAVLLLGPTTVLLCEAFVVHAQVDTDIVVLLWLLALGGQTATPLEELRVLLSASATPSTRAVSGRIISCRDHGCIMLLGIAHTCLLEGDTKCAIIVLICLDTGLEEGIFMQSGQVRVLHWVSNG